MSKLYEINEKFNIIDAMLEADEIDQETYNDTLESIEMEFEEKADNIASLIKNLLADEKILKEESANLKARADKKKKDAEWLRSYLSREMQAANKGKIETPHNLISFRKSTSLFVENEEAFMVLHPGFIRTKTETLIDKKAVTDQLKDGKLLRGAELVSKQNIQIK